MTDALQISTLGGLDVRLNGATPDSLGSLKAAGLFVYLACTGQSHSRESLVDVLWDDLAPSQGLNNLRWLLSLLRKQFAPYLNITRSTVAFAPQCPYRLDSAAFEQLLATAEAAGAGATAALAEAVALYKGPFLSGFYLREASRFEEWMLAEQERLHHRMVAALHRLAADSLARRDYAAGLPFARRLAQLAPLDEQAARLLMRLLAAGGDNNAALEQFEQLRRDLEGELGVAPERATLDLAAEIRAARQAPLVAPRREVLPRYFTPFVGREDERRELAARLADPATRLITLHGPGGSGKTRLAVEVARAAAGFPDGVYFVPLEGVDRGAALVSAIAEALDFPLQSFADPLRQLIAYLGGRRVLLLLDNFEQLVDWADQLLLLLGAADGLKLLVTSQAQLDLAAEVVWSLEGLPLPPEHAADVAGYGAVQLFVERARRVLPRFALDEGNSAWVGLITRLTEGLPLALELAAARLRDEAGPDIVSALQADIDLLSTTRRDVPPRQRSLRAVFDHSCCQLAPATRASLAVLGVFRGAFTPEAAAAVLQSTEARAQALLDELSERSLLRRAQQGSYQMHGLLRGYALEMLPAAQADEVYARHAAYFLARTQAAARLMPGPAEHEGLAQIAGDYDNIRVALDRSAAGPETTLRFCVALMEFWSTYGGASVGREYVERALAGAAALPVELRARGLLVAGRLGLGGGDYVRAAEQLRESMALASGDEPWERHVRAWALRSLATVGIQLSDFAAAADHSRRSLELFVGLGDLPGRVSALWALGLALSDSGEYAAAARLLDEGLALARRLGHRSSIGNFLRNIGVLNLYGGQLEQATAHLQQALAIFEQVQHLVNIADTHFYLGLAELGRNNGRAAEERGRLSLDLARQLRSRFLIAGATFLLGGAALFQGRLDEAAAYARDGVARHYEMSFHPFLSRGLEHLAAIAAAQGRFRRAVLIAAAADAWRAGRGDVLDPGYAAMHSRTLAAARAHLDEAAFNAALAAGQRLLLPELISAALEDAA